MSRFMRFTLLCAGVFICVCTIWVALISNYNFGNILSLAAGIFLILYSVFVTKIKARPVKFVSNTAIAAMMSLINEIFTVGTLTVDEYKVLLRLLCPFAPHLCEELWEKTGETGFCSLAKWPEYDESKCVDKSIEIAVQVNGKLRGRVIIAADAAAADAIAAAKAEPRVASEIDGKQIVKELYVPGKLVNIVAK